MRYNRDVHRRSIRLRGFDYSQPGAYFITVCTHERAPLFGDVVNGAMVLNAAGAMVDAVWRDMPDHYSGVVLGEHIVMPNHFHGVVEIVGAGPRACPDPMECACPDPMECACLDPMECACAHNMPTHETGQPQGVAPTALSLPDLVHRFKSWTTRQYADGVNHYGWPAFNRRLWQRNYYEHIIRHEQAYAAIADYIHHNPQRWQDDVYCCSRGDS